jgi:pimeloyl-ACP methyl ester carboxylesterase
VALISEETIAFVEGVAAEAERLETPCEDGHMIWHIWGAGPPLVLLHGGYGSWTHWIRNVLPLSREFTVAAPDLPGLGESATPPEPHTAAGLARIIVEGLEIAFSRHVDLHIAGFSFGGVLGGQVAAQLGDRVGVYDRRVERSRSGPPAHRARARGRWRVRGRDSRHSAP